MNPRRVLTCFIVTCRRPPVFIRATWSDIITRRPGLNHAAASCIVRGISANFQWQVRRGERAKDSGHGDDCRALILDHRGDRLRRAKSGIVEAVAAVVTEERLYHFCSQHNLLVQTCAGGGVNLGAAARGAVVCSLAWRDDRVVYLRGEDG